MKKRLSSPRFFFLGVLGLALYFALAGGDYSILDARRAEAELAAKRAEIEDVRREINSLRERIATLRNDDEALERFARERYGFIRDGEYLYRISEPEASAEADKANRPSILSWLRGRGGSGETE